MQGMDALVLPNLPFLSPMHAIGFDKMKLAAPRVDAAR